MVSYLKSVELAEMNLLELSPLTLLVWGGLLGVFCQDGLYCLNKMRKKCTLSLLNISAFIC